MNRLNALFTLVIAALFVLLMQFAGQPITPEADLVQRWYDALCNPAADQSPLLELMWRGDLSDDQLQTAVDAYRAVNNFSGGCTATVNHNIIYFQWIPPQLVESVERIKFVAVNVYPVTVDQTPNHVLSIRTGIHVLYDRSGRGYIFPRFLPVSPLGAVEAHSPVALYNNDGLLMGQAEVLGLPMTSEQNGTTHIGIPIALTASRAWGHYWVRIYADGVEVVPDLYADVLPPDQQAGFVQSMGENIPTNTVISGLVWFTAPRQPADIRFTVDADQTLWDIRPLSVMLKVP